MSNRVDEEAAFEHYAAMGPGVRSYQKVADVMGCNKRTVVEIASPSRGNWMERIKRIDAKAQQKAERALIEERAKMTKRHIAAYQLLQKKAIQRLAQEGTEFDDDISAARALDIAVKGERLVRGESTENISGKAVVQHVMAITQPPPGMSPDQWRDRVNQTAAAIDKAREIAQEN